MTVRILSLGDLDDTLPRRFAAGDGVIWTGAGVSARSTKGGAGVPSSEELRNHLARWSQPPPRTAAGVPAGTIQYWANRYVQRHAGEDGRDRLDRLLRRVYAARGAAAPEFYRLIGLLPDSVDQFITTNYDAFLERALERRAVQCVVRGTGLAAVSVLYPVVYKVHGDAATPGTCILTDPDYQAWQDTSGLLPDKLRIVIAERSVVAIGYGGRDWNIQRLFTVVGGLAAAGGAPPRPLTIVAPIARREDFAQFEGGTFDVDVISATGDAFLIWLIEALVRLEVAALEERIDSTALQSARTRVAEATAPHGQRDLGAIGTAYDALATALSAEGRQEEALRAAARAVRARVEAGDLGALSDRGTALLTTLTNKVRDASLAWDLYRLMTAPVALGKPWILGDWEFEAAAKYARILLGDPGEDPAVPDALTNALTVPAASEAMQRAIECRIAQLRAGAAVSRLDFAEAGLQYNNAALLDDDPSRAATWRVRSLLAQGLNGDPASAQAGLTRLIAPADVEPLRDRALGWVATLAGDSATGLGACLAAAKRALSGRDTVAAATAYRSAEWAERQRPTPDWTQRYAGNRAYRLEQIVPPENQAYQTPRTLAARADRAHADRESAHDIARFAHAAQRLAYEDADPAGLDLARVHLATAWLAALEGLPNDRATLTRATYYAGVTLSDVTEDNVAAFIAPLIRSLERNRIDGRADSVVAVLTGGAVGAHEQTGMLRLMRYLAPSLGAALAADAIAAAVRRGLVFGWALNGRVDGASAACELLGELAPQLSGVQLSGLAQELLQRAPAVPFTRGQELYAALVAALEGADLGPDGGFAIAQTLVAARPADRGAPWAFALDAALSILGRRGMGDTTSLAAETLGAAAARGEWGALECLAHEHLVVPRGVGDRFLEALRDQCAGVRALSGTNTIAGGTRPLRGAIRYAAVNGDAGLRDAVLANVLGLLADQGLALVMRTPWVFTGVMLAGSSDAGRDRAADVLEELASDALSARGGREPSPPHPLADFRVDFGSPDDARVVAMRGLGYLFPFLAPARAQHALDLLLDAAISPDAGVRIAAACGLGELVLACGGAPNALSAIAVNAEAPAVERAAARLQSLLHDVAAEVRTAATYAVANSA